MMTSSTKQVLVSASNDSKNKLLNKLYKLFGVILLVRHHFTTGKKQSHLDEFIIFVTSFYECVLDSEEIFKSFLTCFIVLGRKELGSKLMRAKQFNWQLQTGVSLIRCTVKYIQSF